ncbi:hypothetical protein [Bacillus sp. SLBN-46]|uniref:hypothetical protein n=1 Tax=Bacillus sp. SLBN-46 TaxID=3042283 RepID=UPI00286AE291|nr:hypothetical protein [Bacillus sp. SLBN-46]
MKTWDCFSASEAEEQSFSSMIGKLAVKLERERRKIKHGKTIHNYSIVLISDGDTDWLYPKGPAGRWNKADR